MPLPPRPFRKARTPIRALRLPPLWQGLRHWWQGLTASFWDGLCALREQGIHWLLHRDRTSPRSGRFRAQLEILELEPRLVLNAMRSLPGFAANALPGNNDGSSGPVSLGFTVAIGGTNYNTVYVNNNGNATFGNASSASTPYPLSVSPEPILAPFFANADTRLSGSVTYGADTVNWHPAFGVDWNNVDYFDATAPGHVSKDNSFELVIVSRPDLGAGDFTIEFNYNTITWNTGDASGGSDGLGGTSARAGYSLGLSLSGSTSYELPGSGVNGALLDSNPTTGLADNSENSGGVPGRYDFDITGGTGGTDTVTAQNDTYSVLHDRMLSVLAPGVLANDSDSLNKPLTASLVSGPSAGTLELNSNGSFEYSPDAGFVGSDSFV